MHLQKLAGKKRRKRYPTMWFPCPEPSPALCIENFTKTYKKGKWNLAPSEKSKGKLILNVQKKNCQYLQIKRSRLCQLHMLLLILI